MKIVVNAMGSGDNISPVSARVYQLWYSKMHQYQVTVTMVPQELRIQTITVLNENKGKLLANLTITLKPNECDRLLELWQWKLKISKTKVRNDCRARGR